MENKKLINPVKRILPYECPKCGNKTINIYDKWDKRVNYSLLCRYNTYEQVKRKLENTDLKYMRCDACKSIFILDWSREKIPYPISKDIFIKFEATKN